MLSSYEHKLLWNEIERFQKIVEIYRRRLDVLESCVPKEMLEKNYNTLFSSDECVCGCHPALEGCGECCNKWKKKTKTYWVNVYKTKENYYTGRFAFECKEEAESMKEDSEANHTFVKFISFDVEVEE